MRHVETRHFVLSAATNPDALRPRFAVQSLLQELVDTSGTNLKTINSSTLIGPVAFRDLPLLVRCPQTRHRSFPAVS
ncbi:hypothetical protein C0081_13510 [Cohaesibacter celericrescens]|uniref:Uncharacterized protein n=1 Tax=Cohaesibacter celericrescens TaxID=2067669 RepID=A0A2N5XRB3_9HYPH|nr:hypothetical protein C0081_13510 [Cohaesibacter celericrescens]